MNWTLLGIAPTQDKQAITAAYRVQLAYTNPEDKPEEFKALRTAYEEARLRLWGYFFGFSCIFSFCHDLTGKLYRKNRFYVLRLSFKALKIFGTFS